MAKREKKALRKAALAEEALASTIVDPEGNMWIRAEYRDVTLPVDPETGEHEFVQIASLRIDNQYKGNGNLKGLLQRDSDAMVAGTASLDDVLADYASNLRFVPERAAKAAVEGKPKGLSQHIRAKAGDGDNRNNGSQYRGNGRLTIPMGGNS